jgi:L-lactate dehydrogenase complex protein LldF
MAVKGQHQGFTEKQGIRLSTIGLKSRNKMNIVSGNTKNALARSFLKKSWGAKRELPNFARKSFNEQWKEKHGND